MFTVNRQVLEAELALLQTVAERKGTIPALGTILFEVAEGKLSLTATDLDVTLTTQIEAEGEQWSGCIPMRQLCALVSLFSEDVIQFTLKGERVELKSGSSKHSLPIMARDEYPDVKQSQVETIQLDAKVFSGIIGRTSFAVSSEKESRYNMQGVFIAVKDKTLQAVATNGVHLAVAKTSIGSDSEFSVLLPARVLPVIMKLADEGELSFGANENQALFKTGNRSLTTALLDAKFPNWELVVPQVLEHKAEIDRGELLAGIKRAAVTAREAKLVRYPLKLTFSKTGLLIESDSEDGDSFEPIKSTCSTLNGSEMNIRINGEHFLAFLSKTEGAVICEFTSPSSQILLSNGSPDYKYVTMPLKF